MFHTPETYILYPSILTSRGGMQVANRCCQGRIVSVLEGGYRIQGGLVSAFARSVAAHVDALKATNQQVVLIICACGGLSRRGRVTVVSCAFQMSQGRQACGGIFGARSCIVGIFGMKGLPLLQAGGTYQVRQGLQCPPSIVSAVVSDVWVSIIARFAALSRCGVQLMAQGSVSARLQRGRPQQLQPKPLSRG